MRQKRELHCCLGCGRDTYGLYCNRCVGHTTVAGNETEQAAMPLEDDYSEESDANSVCQDNFALVGKE